MKNVLEEFHIEVKGTKIYFLNFGIVKTKKYVEFFAKERFEKVRIINLCHDPKLKMNEIYGNCDRQTINIIANFNRLTFKKFLFYVYHEYCHVFNDHFTLGEAPNMSQFEYMQRKEEFTANNYAKYKCEQLGHKVRIVEMFKHCKFTNDEKAQLRAIYE